MRARVAKVLALAATLTTMGAAPDLQPPRQSREQMESALEGGARFLFVYGTQRPGSAAALRGEALQLARHLFDRDSTAVRADRDVPAESLAVVSPVLVGGPDENLWTRRLAAALPVTFAAHGFRWFDRLYDRPGDVLHLVYPNPLAPGRFLLLVLANAPGALEHHAGFYFGEEDWRIERDGTLSRSGRFAQSPGAPWHYDPALDHDLERERERFATGLRRTAAPGVEIFASPEEAQAAAWSRAASALFAHLEALGFGASSAPARVTIYRSLEEKGRLTRDTRPEHLAGAREAMIALPTGRAAPDLWSVAALRLTGIGAAPASPWLEPAGAWLAGRWGGEPLDRAIARLYFARLLPTAREAAARGDAWRSPLLRVPARAALSRAIFESAPGRGRAAVLATLTASPPGTLDSLCRRAGVETGRVERRYANLVDSLARLGRKNFGAAAPRPWRPADGFMRGICLAHSVSLERGYLSGSCARELERIRALGASWVSITPFGYVAGSASPEIYPSAEGGPDEETDEAVIEAAARARALGLRVLLAPHLWSREWTGSMQFGTAGWPRFFERYRTFLLHYAVLAQRQGIDGLAVGHELGSATLAYPDRWRALIGEVRRVYDGTVTYGANWDHEVEDIAFWDACDLIGVSFYYPLATAPGASRAAMTAAARRALASLDQLARRTGRPVLLTEAGYASTPDAPVRPWEERRAGAADLAVQRECYEALMAALDPESGVAGVFIWKWFSAPPPGASPAGGAADRSFSPQGKPAQAVLARSFGAWRERPVRVPARAP